jgi:hypothetical protein
LQCAHGVRQLSELTEHPRKVGIGNTAIRVSYDGFGEEFRRSLVITCKFGQATESEIRRVILWMAFYSLAAPLRCFDKLPIVHEMMNVKG